MAVAAMSEDRAERVEREAINAERDERLRRLEARQAATEAWIAEVERYWDDLRRVLERRR